MSFVGNCGTFTRGYKAMIMDVEFLYHLLYLLICALGLFVHEFFYSLLVGIHFVFRMFFFLCACKVPPRCHPLLAFCFTAGHCRASTLENGALVISLRSYCGRLQDPCPISSS